MSKKLPKGNMSLFDFQERYDTEDKCREYFLRLRYPTGSFVRTAEGRNAGRSRLAIASMQVLPQADCNHQRHSFSQLTPVA